MGRIEVWDRVGFAIAISFLIAAACVGLYDLWVVMGPPKGTMTVSAYIVRWSHEYPILPYAMGFVLGHLFFPMFGGRP